MLGGGARNLRRGREMDESVPGIVGTATIRPLPLGLAPGRGRANLVNRGHGPAIPASYWICCDFRNIASATVSAASAHFKSDVRQ
jgi:hypothetical protein